MCATTRRPLEVSSETTSSIRRSDPPMPRDVPKAKFRSGSVIRWPLGWFLVPVYEWRLPPTTSEGHLRGIHTHP